MATPATVQAQEIVAEWKPLIVSGEQAAEIVKNGQVRASSSESFQGFLLLVEYRGRTYTCSVMATGQVLPCYALVW